MTARKELCKDKGDRALKGAVESFLSTNHRDKPGRSCGNFNLILPHVRRKKSQRPRHINRLPNESSVDHSAGLSLNELSPPHVGGPIKLPALHFCSDRRFLREGADNFNQTFSPRDRPWRA